MRGGKWRLRMKAQYVSSLPIPPDIEELAAPAEAAHRNSNELAVLVSNVHYRLSDISPAIRTIRAFHAWPDLDFAGLRALIVKRCKTDIPPGERDDWERWFAGKRAEAAALRAAIAAAEAEINDRVYRLFGLDADEIALIEESLAGQY